MALAVCLSIGLVQSASAATTVPYAVIKTYKGIVPATLATVVVQVSSSGSAGGTITLSDTNGNQMWSGPTRGTQQLSGSSLTAACGAFLSAGSVDATVPTYSTPSYPSVTVAVFNCGAGIADEDNHYLAILANGAAVTVVPVR